MADHLAPLSQGVVGSDLVLQINDRLRRIDIALNAPAIAAATAGPILYGAHADRLSRPVAPDATIYFEADRAAFYQVQGRQWKWIAGMMQAAWATMPVDLGKNDAGFVFRDNVNSLHIWQWSGTAWTWGPGNRASGEMAEFDADPGIGWHICDGAVNQTKYAANGTRVTTFTVPDRRTFYTQGAAAYTGVGVPAAVPPGSITLGTATGSVAAGTGAPATFLTGVSVTAFALATPPVPTFATLYYYRL